MCIVIASEINYKWRGNEIILLGIQPVERQFLLLEEYIINMSVCAATPVKVVR